jgi:hypothetical protein
MMDCQDGCPDDPDKIAPGICGCGTLDTDADGDATPDCDDQCPNDPAKVLPGQCGCGIADGDADGDGVANCDDGCPSDPGKTAPGICGCGVADTDSDGDGTPSCNDGCDDDPNKTEPGLCGCGTPDADTDGDGIIECVDPCPGSSGNGWVDVDDVTFWFRLEGASLHPDDDHSAGDTEGNLLAGAQLTAAAARTGAWGLHVSEPFGGIEFEAADIVAASSARVGFWLRVNEWVDGTELLRLSRGLFQSMTLRMAAGSELSFVVFNSSQSFTTSGAAIEIGVWHYVEVAWNNGTGFRGIFVDGQPVGSSTAPPFTLPSPSRLRIGNGSFNDGDFHIDQVVIRRNESEELYPIREVFDFPQP